MSLSTKFHGKRCLFRTHQVHSWEMKKILDQNTRNETVSAETRDGWLYSCQLGIASAVPSSVTGPWWTWFRGSAVVNHPWWTQKMCGCASKQPGSISRSNAEYFNEWTTRPGRQTWINSTKQVFNQLSSWRILGYKHNPPRFQLWVSNPC